MVVWLKPHVVFEAIVVVTNSYVFMMYVHVVHHHDESPSMYDNHIGHLLHRTMHAIIVLELLLPIVVIYFSLASFVVGSISFATPIMSCFPCVLDMVCTIDIPRIVTLNGLVLPLMNF